MGIIFHSGRAEKVRNLRTADYKCGYDKLLTAKHSRKRLHQLKRREARHIGHIIEY